MAIALTARQPPPVLFTAAASAFLPSAGLFVHGGGGRGRGQVLSDLWRVSWATESPNPSYTKIEAVGLPALSHHAMVAVPPPYASDPDGDLIFIGGFDGRRRTSNVFHLALSTLVCRRLPPHGDVPATGRSSHSATLFLVCARGHICAHILVVGRETGQRRWSDVHCFNLETERWTYLGPAVSSRSGHAAVLLTPFDRPVSASRPARILLWGGRNSPTADLGFLSLGPDGSISAEWTTLVLSRSEELVAGQHAAVIPLRSDPEADVTHLVIFGGSTDGRHVSPRPYALRLPRPGTSSPLSHRPLPFDAFGLSSGSLCAWHLHTKGPETDSGYSFIVPGEPLLPTPGQHRPAYLEPICFDTVALMMLCKEAFRIK
jgi:hypothetical protein